MWWYILWWLVICHGSVALGVATINRLHGLPLPEWAVHLSHKIHYLLNAAIPVYALIATGWYGPGLLWGGQWCGLSAAWWIAFAICAAATLIFWGSVLRRHLRRTPGQQLRFQSQRRDIAQELGSPPVGAGPYQWLTRLPGNEVFRLEITERELMLPRLAPVWDGLSILHFSDIHFIGTVGLPYFERVLEEAQALQPDLICFTGDLVDDMTLTSWLPTTLGRMRAPLGRFFILGNHDWQLDMPAIRRELQEIGWQDVSTVPRLLERGGQRLHFIGSEAPWVAQAHAFDDPSESTVRILLSHSPDNLQQARRQRVDLMLSGHVHGGQIRLPVIGPIYCPSRFGCRYSEGVFWETPTLLHVSRGLAGRHPVRYGCLPEITKLVLRCPDRTQ